MRATKKKVGDLEVQIFDFREDPCLLKPGQWFPSVERDPAKARGICAHQWGTKVGTTIQDRKRYGEPLALALRARAVSAHVSVGVTSHGVPIVALAHPLDRHVFHGDSANGAFVGFEVMGLFPYTELQRSPRHSEVTPELQVAVVAGLQATIEMLDEWAGPHPWELITHRQGINGRGDHEQCCGEAVLAMCLRSNKALQERLIPLPNEALKPPWSKPWPPEWCEHLSTTQDREEIELEELLALIP